MLDTLGSIYLRRENAKRSPASSEVVDAHMQTHDQIERVLSETGLYHGTGRFSYMQNGESKYDGIQGDEVVDVFSLLLEQGLVPQDDLLSDLFVGEELSTLSLTHLRMYARVYADLFRDEEDEADSYRHGSNAFWWRLLCAKMAVHIMTDPDYYRSVAEYYLRTRWSADKQAAIAKRMGRLNAWQGSFRNDEKYQFGAFFGANLMGLMSHGRSTIPENHGMIVGVRAGAVTPVPLQRGYARCFEVRAAEPIATSDWTYVEAPMQRVGEVEDLVDSVGLKDLPVFSTEVMEYHHSQMSLPDLSQKHIAARRPNLLVG